MANLKEFFEYFIKLFEWWVIVMPWENGLRIRFGKKVKLLEKGIFLKLPFIDTVYIQTIRLRVVHLPLQTITTKDGHSISIASAVGYSISDIQLLYEKLFQPESTICNMALGEVSEYVSNSVLTECSPKQIEEVVKLKLSGDQYGIRYDYLKIIGYSVVRTYRLIQDSHWMPDGLNMTTKQ